MKCSNCGSESPDDSKFCRQCGSPLGSLKDPLISIQRGFSKAIGYTFVLISILLIVVGFGFKAQADDIPDSSSNYILIHALMDLAWLFALLGVAGFVVAGVAYLFSLPGPARKKSRIEPALVEDRKEEKHGL